jgi:hypothetical protein
MIAKNIAIVQKEVRGNDPPKHQDKTASPNEPGSKEQP